GRFGKDGMQRVVQGPRRRQVVAERFFDDNPRPGSAPGLAQPLYHSSEQAWRNRQVVRRVRCSAKNFSKLLKGRGVLIVAVDVLQQAGEPVKRRFVDASVLAEGITGSLA